MAQLPQPNFEQLAQSLTGVVDQVLLMPNVPAVNNGATILAELRQITANIGALVLTVDQLRDNVHNISTRLNAR